MLLIFSFNIQRILQICCAYLKHTINLHYFTVLHWPKYLLHPAWHLFLPRQGAESDRGWQPRPSPASSPRCQAEVAVSLASLGGGEAATVVVWWCILYILDLFEWNFNQSLNLAGCLPQSSPPRPPSPPTHPSLTQHTAILYCTEQCQPWRKKCISKLKNSLTFFVLFYILL